MRYLRWIERMEKKFEVTGYGTIDSRKSIITYVDWVSRIDQHTENFL